MAASGDVIQSFLVSLGFDVDESSLALFNKNVQTAALRITSLYGAVNAFAGGIVYAFSEISNGFEQLGYSLHIVAPAVNKMIALRQEMLRAYSAAGVNIREVVGNAIQLNFSLAKTKIALEAIYKSVGSKFFGLLQKQSDAFRKRLYENMPYIIHALEKLVSTVFKAFDIVTQFGLRVYSILSRVYDFFVSLDQATDGWSTIVLGVLAAWKLLNLEFLATPLGALVAGFVALLTLFDDYKTWQEGGESLFNWTKFVPVIDAVTQELKILREVLDGIFTTIFHIGGAVVDVFEGKWGAAVDRVKDAFGGVKDAIGSGFDAIKGASNIGVAGYNFGASALGSNPGQASNINANMQTSINITGSPNADATARATAREQQNVNRDMTRNLKGATR